MIGVSFEPSKHLGRNHDLPFLLRCGSHKFNITAAKHIMQITALSRLKLPSLNRLAGNGQRRGLSVYDIFRYTLSIDRCAFLGYIYIYISYIHIYIFNHAGVDRGNSVLQFQLLYMYMF